MKQNKEEQKPLTAAQMKAKRQRNRIIMGKIYGVALALLLVGGLFYMYKTYGVVGTFQKIENGVKSLGQQVEKYLHKANDEIEKFNENGGF